MKKRIFSFVLTVLMIASLLPATALAVDIVKSGTCGAEVTWTLDSEGVLTISGIGAMKEYGPYKAPWYGSSSRVKSAVIAEGVTSIGSSAFDDCTSLTSVTIPDSVTSIGDDAFYDCTSLTSVTIPDSVTSIGDSAFASCTSLTGIWVAEGNSHYSSDASGVLFNKDKTTLVQCPGAFAAYAIPDSVTSIGADAFYGCTSLKSVTIPDSVTNIGADAFSHCTSLTSVTIPDSVTSIGEQAFQGCESLTSVTIPDSVTSISSYTFASCTSLTSVTIPNSVTSIGEKAFYNCRSLTSVTIPDSVTSIGDGAFASCTSLTGIWVSEGNSHYSSDASGVLFNKDKTTLVQCPGAFAAYTIPDSVTSIVGYAFYYCTSLTSVTILNGVTSIGSYAFVGCTSLTDVYYAGSEAQWKAIQISYGNDALLNANIHYNYVSHTHSYKDVVTAPTCTEKGYTTHTCACGDSYVDTYTDALGHAWDNGKVTKEPTETETGVKIFTCTRCGETRTETMPVIPHVHSYKDVVTAPTCTEKGYTTHTCACGDSYVDTYTDALGHAWDEGTVTKEATETTQGSMTYTCTRCPATKRDILPASGLVATAVYNDVKNDTSWFYPGVQYCLSYGLMSGMGNGSFAPGEYTTRAQVAQILYNLHGNPEVSGGTPFTDVPEGAWYQKAVTWAHSVGIVNGVTATTFSPNANITRQDFVLMLMRYLNNVRMVDRTWTPDDLSRFADAGSVGFWALDAMKDAVAINAISGAPVDGRLYIQPARNATRAEAAKILMMFHETMTK